MDQEYENKLKRCDIRKGHIVQVIVKETSSNFPQGGGDVLWRTTGKDFGSMHAVIKAIYEALPDYKGKRIWVEVKNMTNGMVTICSSHYIPKNRIPFTLG